MVEKIKENRTITELITGIIIFCVVSQIVMGILCMSMEKFQGRGVYFGAGIWIGMIIAIIMAWHMNRSIYNAIDFDEGTATKMLQKSSVLRYAALVLIMAGIMLLDIVSPLTTFLGVMGLKMGAYMQPFTHKIYDKIVGPEPVNTSMPIEDEEYDKMYAGDMFQDIVNKNHEKAENADSSLESAEK